MLRRDKEALVAEIAELLKDTESLLISDYRGLSVAELSELRGKLRQSGASFRVVKNTLAKIAAERAGRDGLAPLLTGPTAVTICGEDAVAAAKALADYARLHPALVMRGGLMADTVVDAAGVKTLAMLPSRETLLAQVVGTMAAPMTGLVTVLQGTISGFVRALSQVAEQKAAAEGA
jgi:large subunit ribosomal protein L10